MDFTQLYSPEQRAAFARVRDALVADPTALDNRGGIAQSVVAATSQQETGNGNS